MDLVSLPWRGWFHRSEGTEYFGGTRAIYHDQTWSKYNRSNNVSGEIKMDPKKRAPKRTRIIRREQTRVDQQRVWTLSVTALSGQHPVFLCWCMELSIGWMFIFNPWLSIFFFYNFTIFSRFYPFSSLWLSLSRCAQISILIDLSHCYSNQSNLLGEKISPLPPPRLLWRMDEGYFGTMIRALVSEERQVQKTRTHGVHPGRKMMSILDPIRD